MLHLPPYRSLLNKTGGAEVNAFLSRTSGLDSKHINAYIDLISGLVADGIWSKLDVLHIYATQDSTTALLNLVSTSYPAVLHGSPTFTVDRSFSGGLSGGSTVFIDTGFNPRTATTPQAAQNSMHLSAWSTLSASDNGSIMGAIDSGSAEIVAIKPRDLSGNFLIFVNNATPVSAAMNPVNPGHFIANRSSSSTVTGYWNGVSQFTNSSNTSINTVNASIYVLSLNNIGTAAGSVYQASAASIGSSLSGTDALNFNNRLRTYMTVVGVP